METSLLRHRPFMTYWMAQNASTFGNQFLVLALGWQLYELTGSALDLGYLGLVQFFPALLLGLAAGQLADRMDRRRIARACAIVNCIIACVLVAGSSSHWLSREVIFACVFVLGATRGFESPSMAALVPIVVSRDLLPRALASSGGAKQAAVVLGPALGGVLYLLGPAVVYGTGAVFYLAAGALIGAVAIQEQPPARKDEPVTLATVFAGLTYIRGKPVVFGAITLDLFAVILGGATALLPIYAKDILNTGPWGLGLLRAAPALGAVIAAAWLVHHPIQKNLGLILFGSIMAFGLFTILFGISTSLPLSLAMLALLGGADMVSAVIRRSLIQLETPNEMRGRVSAIHHIFTGSSNQLGQFESGLTAAWWGAVPAVVVGGVGTIAVAALWMKWFPEISKRQTINPVP